MFQSRRFDPVLQRAALSRTHFRGARSLGVSLALGASLLALAACGNTSETEEAPTESAAPDAREVLVTAAFTGVEGGASALAFLPDPNAPSLGYVVSATRQGGLDLFDLDGALKTRQAGERLSGLATAPAFQLRGENLPLIFGAAPDSGRLVGYGVVRSQDQVVEIPLQTLEPVDGLAGLCLLREGTGFVELVILGTGARAEIWRVRDSGEDVLSVEHLRDFPLPAPARQCASFDDDIYTTSPGGGLTRLSSDGAVLAEASFAASGLTVDEYGGTRLVLATNGNDPLVQAFTARDLEPRDTIDIIDGLSTRGVGQPAAIASTGADYGFTAYSGGLLAVFDAEDQRIKVVSRDAFTRAMLAPTTSTSIDSE
ncbi:hypothetical protein [Maricaulis sp. CAU 1757]